MNDIPVEVMSSPITRSSRRRGSISSHHHHADPAKRVLVDHTYIDHLHDPPTASVEAVDIQDSKSAPKGPRGGVTVAFPEKLHQMLSQIDDEGLSRVVSWQPHGRCFLVHRKKEFIDEVMPRFFHQSKLTSFQRQLNLYGFVRLTAGRDRGGYYHELFIRGRSDLCRRMVRTRVKGNGMKAASNPQNEPNFYAMEGCKSIYDHEHAPVIMQTESLDETLLDIDQPPEMTSPVQKPIVTPVQSPRQSLCLANHLPERVFMLELAEPPKVMDYMNEIFLGSVVREDNEPHNGDEILFEGHKFCYLDHMEPEGTYDNTLLGVADSVV